MLRVSRGLSWVHSGERVCGSDSPVREELSTLQPWACRMRMSAGTRSPPFISTRSPTTSWSALIWNLSPSLITVACCGGDRIQVEGVVSVGGKVQRVEDLQKGVEDSGEGGWEGNLSGGISGC